MSATRWPGLMPSRSMTRSASPWPSRVFSLEYSGDTMPATGRSGAGKSVDPGLPGGWPHAKSASRSAKTTRRHLTFARPPPSDAQEALLDLRIGAERGRRALELDVALVQDVKAMGERERHFQHLLDEQDGRPAPVDLAQDPGQVLDEDRGEALRRLVHQHELGARDEAARDGQHLLLAAGERLALLLVAIPKAREIGQHLFHHGAVVGRRAVGRAQDSQAQILGHAQVGQDPPLLGHIGDAGARHLVGGQLRELAAVEGDGAAARGDQPHDALERRRLARAVPADERHDLTGADRERDALQDVRVAVLRVETLDGEQRHLAMPRYVCCTRTLARISAGVPSASTWPWCNTVMRSEMFI